MLIFQPVPEHKAGKNRLHLDVRATGSQADERFLTKAKLLPIGDKYLDGYAAARVLGVPMDDDDK